MRGLALVALLVAAVLPFPARAQDVVHRAIDPMASRAQFSIAHVFVLKVDGTIAITGGSVELVPGSAIPLRATATLDPASIKTGEPDRDASLAGPSYFDAKAFPQWTFSSTKIVASGPSAFTMDGDLTIHGVTHPQTLTVTVSGDAAHPVYRAAGRIDRRIWGMPGTRLDPAIGTVADVTLTIVLK